VFSVVLTTENTENAEVVMKNKDELLKAITRRHFFAQSGIGIGTVALTSLLNEKLFSAAQLGSTHFPPKAKNVIYLFMAGAPSQLDLFDEKPKLKELNDKNIPEEMIQGERFAFIKGTPQLLGSPYAFKPRGKSGAILSDLLPGLSEVVDDLAFVKSMYTDQFNHAPAQIFMNTGHQIIGRPSMGSWMTYGLGSEGKDLPGFVVLVSGIGQPDGGKSCWSSGFLPTTFRVWNFVRRGSRFCLSRTHPESARMRGAARSMPYAI